VNPFEDEMQAFERADRIWPPPHRPVLFYGSSSIRLWDSLRDDFPGVPVLNRGFGGSSLELCVRYMHRLVFPYNPQAIVLYAGDNDLADGPRSPEQVAGYFDQFIWGARTRLGEIPVTVLSVKPSPSRMHLIDKIRRTNELFQEVAARHPAVRYVDIFHPMLGPDGLPRRELFADDGLHLSRAGYRVWRRCLRPDGSEFFDDYRKPLLHMNREYHKWYSHRLHRDMELLVFGHAGARVLVFPTRAGRFFDYEDGGLVASIAHKIESGWLQLFCVDSMDADSLYCFWKHPAERIKRHMQYEQYILDEVLPFTVSKNSNPFLIAHGCSLGAYHAMNIALRHPGRFGKVVSLSGRYDLTVNIEDFRGLFDGYWDENIYFHNPSSYIPQLTDEKLLEQIRRLQITLVIGREDPFCPNNKQFSDALWQKNIRHELHWWDGRAHRYREWRHMVPQYL
jgi:esterase/lipase superfamily enzyme/lysophospholipase L1-like esterase